MAIRSVMIPQTGCTTDALMRAAWQSFHDALVAVGLVWDQAAPGQIDLSTATRPAGAAQTAGYRWYRFNDALQATAPVHIWVAYGTEQLSNNGPSFSMWVGQLTAPGTYTFKNGKNIQALAAPGYTFGTALNSLFSGDGSRIQIALWRSNGYASCVGTLERTKNTSGVDTPDGILTTTHWTNFKFSAGLLFGSTVNQFNTNVCGCIVPPTGTGVSGSDKYVYPRRINTGHLNPPLLGIVSYFDADFTKDVPVSIQMYDGVSHTYYPIGNSDSLNQCHDNITSPGTVYSMIRWE